MSCTARARTSTCWSPSSRRRRFWHRVRGSVGRPAARSRRGRHGTTARLIDIPPLELQAARATLVDLRSHAEELPSPQELAAVYEELRRTADEEQRPLLEVSAGVGLAFLTAAGIVGREHVARPYGEDWEPLRQEGFAAYAKRISGPYRQALVEHLDTERPSFTERALGRLSRDV